MATAYFGNASDTTATTKATYTLTLPSSIPDGSLALIVFSCNGTTATITTAPSSATQIQGLTAAGTSLQSVFYKQAVNSGDSGGSISLTWSASVKGGAALVVISGGTDTDVVSSVQTDSGADTTFNIPTITPAHDDCMWVALGGTNYPTTGGLSSWPTNWTGRVDTSSTGGTPLAGAAIGTRQLTGQNGVNQGTVDGTYSATGRDVTLSVTVTPTAAGGTTASPSAVAAVASVGSPTITLGTSTSPAVVAAIGAVPAASVIAGGGATAGATAVAAIAAVPAPTLLTTVKPTPAVVAGVAAIAAPDQINTDYVKVATTVAGVAAVGAPTIPSPAFSSVISDAFDRAGNMATANQSSVETSIADWAPGGTVLPTLTQSAVRAFDGTKSLLITWGTGGSFPLAVTTMTGLTVGATYTASVYAWVPTGSPNVVAVIAGTGIFSNTTSTKDAWVRCSVTFTATAISHDFQIWPDVAPTAGQTCYVDAFMVGRTSRTETYTQTNYATGLGNADSGQTWNQTGWGIVDDKAKVVSTTDATYSATVDTGITSQQVSATFTLSATRSNIGLHFKRNSSGTSGFFARLSKTSTVDLVELTYVSAGVSTVIGSYNYNLVAGNTYTMTVNCNATTIQVLIGTAEIFSYTMTGTQQGATSTNTYAGLRCRYLATGATGDDGTSTVDNFAVNNAPAPPAASAALTQGWSTASRTTAGTTLTLAMPWTPTAGRSLIAVVHGESTPTISGWTLRGSATASAGVYVFTKTASGSETNVPVVFAAATIGQVAAAEYANISTTLADSDLLTTFTESTGQVTVTPTVQTNAGGLFLGIEGWRSGSSVAATATQDTLNLTEEADFSTGTVGTCLSLAIASDVAAFSGERGIQATPSGSVSSEILAVSFSPAAGSTIVETVVVSAVAAVPAPTVSVPIPATATPSSVVAVAGIGTVTVVTQGVTLVPAATVAAVAVVNEFPTAITTSLVDPPAVAAVATIPAPTGVGTVSVTTVLAVVVPGVAAVPAPTVTVGVSQTVVTQRVQAVAAQETPDVFTGAATTVSPGTVVAIAAVPAPTRLGQGAIRAFPATVAATSLVGSTTSIVISTPIYVFRTPTVLEGPLALDNPLHARMDLNRAVTILVTGGTVTALRYPTQEQEEAADYVFAGGYEHRVSGPVVDILTAAGYGANITQE